MGPVSRIPVVLLAAGSSTRMGSPKQLLVVNGKPLLRHSVEIALASHASGVIVVLGSQADAIRPALAGLAVETVENPRWSEGMGTSIQTGVEAAQRGDADGLILALADQPRITPEILNRLIATHHATRQPIVASHYADTVGVPVFFAREFFPHLLALKPEQGCKGVILSNAAKTIRLACPEAEADIDTPADYGRLAAEPQS